jgi:hypothetical protein
MASLREKVEAGLELMDQALRGQPEFDPANGSPTPQQCPLDSSSDPRLTLSRITRLAAGLAMRVFAPP